jgi:uncharacterized protein YbjT (DUF2867 family)
MKVIVFGATGMVGQGVLRECLLDPGVDRVLVVGRTPTGQRNDKLEELIHRDFTDFGTAAPALTGYDACFFCLGVSSVGMNEKDYTRVTYDFTMAAAETLARQNPGMTFIYVSGASTDSTEKGRSMWARVKGRTENALLRLPFKAAVMFRPGFIQPGPGVVSKTSLYRAIYAVLGPLYPVWKTLLPNHVTTSPQVGRAMLAVARNGSPQPLLENADINRLGGAAS